MTWHVVAVPQLQVNGSLNQHMAKQVSLFQTPVRTWLPELANQRQPHGDMAVEGITQRHECHPTPDQLGFYVSLLPNASDTAAFWPRKDWKKWQDNWERWLLYGIGSEIKSFFRKMHNESWVQRWDFQYPCKFGGSCFLQKEQWGLAESIDKGTCIVYSQGPGRLTTMRGNKASCYFLTKVQTCIDRNLAPQI